MVIFTNTIFYNCMTIIGSYHKLFTFTEESHLLWNIINLDTLTTCESCSLVKDFSVINEIYCTNYFTYQNNFLSRSIHCWAIILFIDDTYLWLDSSHFCENLLVAKEFICSNKRIFCSIHPRDVRCNLAMHCLVTPFVIWQHIHRPHLLERVYKPMYTPHWHERRLVELST